MNRKYVFTMDPGEDMRRKILRAREAVASQRQRFLLCPYCRHKAVAVFDDTRGHLQAKCSKCGKTTTYNTLDMRRTERRDLPL